MSTIDIEGIIGWDTDIAKIRTQFEAAGDVTVRLHSPGGAVFDGIAIHNIIRDHRRAGHTVTAVVTGLAASMATYIALAANSVAVEDNAVWMVHNPWTLTLGDHREMQKAAETLNGLTGVLAAAYAAKTKKTVKCVRAEMDAETWLYGADIVTAGYADSVITTDSETSSDTAIAQARTTFGAMRHTLKQRGAANDTLDKIAALIQPLKRENPMPEANLEQPNPDQPKSLPETEPVTAPNPDVSAAVQSALAAERARTKNIRDRCNALGLQHLIDALIDSGATSAEVNSKLCDAMAERSGKEIRQTTTANKSSIDVAAIQREIFNQVAGIK